ncbi:hypothetical protein E2562_038122, partial [Oryza meyeriana var. granulata]
MEAKLRVNAAMEEEEAAKLVFEENKQAELEAKKRAEAARWRADQATKEEPEANRMLQINLQEEANAKARCDRAREAAMSAWRRKNAANLLEEQAIESLEIVMKEADDVHSRYNDTGRQEE